jgi:transposase-like protein
MPRKSNRPEIIIGKLRQAEIMMNQGATVAEVCRKIEVTDQTYFRWRKEYGGMRVDQAKRLKTLEEENTRLKKLVANLSLDISILEEAAQGNS